MVNFADWYRIGLDVGGTFTHAVAILGVTGDVVAAAKVPTTHSHKKGIAAGIRSSIEELLNKTGITPPQVRLIAHCTTQTTNALLEGDIAQPGLIVLSQRSQSPLKQLRITSRKMIEIPFAAVDEGDEMDGALSIAIQDLAKKGAQSFAVTKPFGVEDPEKEMRVAEKIRAMGYPAVSAASLTGLYGLQVRTQTALINAGLIPIMFETAQQSAHVLTELGFSQTMLVMRSDGGVVTLSEVEQRPILTILSGPAAGVAGALHFQKLVTGIMIEVGGTSTDISVIYQGRPRIHFAKVGSHRLYIRTIDVRTVGVAGGSLAEVHHNRIVRIGPRSAHIAGLPYACFAKRPMVGPKCTLFSPREGDPQYIVVEDKEGSRYAVTPTCAANYLRKVSSKHSAHGNRDRAAEAFGAVGAYFERAPEMVAQEILKMATAPLAKEVGDLVRALPVPREEMILVGGGGGCAVYLSSIGEKLGIKSVVAPKHDVFSAIGAGLALLHESEEKSVSDFSQSVIQDARGNVEKKLIQMGADPASLEISVDLDRRRGVLRAEGFGSLPMSGQSVLPLSSDQIHKALEDRFVSKTDAVALLEETPLIRIWRIHKKIRRLFWTHARHFLVITAPDGSIRWLRENAQVRLVLTRNADEAIRNIFREESKYGDAGRQLPPIHILIGSRIIDLSGLQTEEEAISMVRNELQRSPSNDKFFLVT